MHARKKIVEGISLRDVIFALRSTVHKPHRAHIRPHVRQVWKLEQPNFETLERILRHPTLLETKSVGAWTCDGGGFALPPFQKKKERTPPQRKVVGAELFHNKRSRGPPRKIVFSLSCGGASPLRTKKNTEKNYKKERENGDNKLKKKKDLNHFKK